jgi:hypothetical protein
VVLVVVPFFKPGVTVSAACRDVASEILRAIDDLGSGSNEGLGESGPGRER